MNSKHMMALVGILAVILVVGTALADEVSFQQGADNALVTNYQGQTDNMIVATYPTGNYGSYATNGVGSMPWANKNNPVRSIMRWDLSAMAGQYRDINAMSLTLYDSSSGLGTSGTVYVYALNPTNAEWVEGTQNDHSTETGSSCWDYTRYDTDAWAGTAGAGPAGDTGTPNDDYDYIALGTYSWSGRTNAGVDISLTGHAGLSLTDLVDQWSGDQAYNAGLILKADAGSEASLGDRFAWRSADWTEISQRPLLTIDFYVPEPTTLVLLGAGALGLMIRRRSRG